MAKVELKQIVAGPGILEWVIISGEGKANLQGVMQYKANVVFEHDSPLLAEYRKDIMEYWEANKPNGYKRKPKSTGMYPIDFELDADGVPIEDDNGNKTPKADSRVALTFKTNTLWPDGNSKVIATHNAKGAKVNLGERKIGNNSVGSVQGKMGIYTSMADGKIVNAGVTLYLDKIQINKLVEYVGDEAAFVNQATDDEDVFLGFDEDNFGTDNDAPAKSEGTTARL